jgi:hypothetical protein
VCSIILGLFFFSRKHQIIKYRSRILGWRAAWTRNESAQACRLKSPSGGVFSVYDFQEMFRNYLTPDNHKSKAYHLHTGRQFWKCKQLKRNLDIRSKSLLLRHCNDSYLPKRSEAPIVVRRLPALAIGRPKTRGLWLLTMF